MIRHVNKNANPPIIKQCSVQQQQQQQQQQQ
jgi:hypothetical protein